MCVIHCQINIFPRHCQLIIIITHYRVAHYFCHYGKYPNPLFVAKITAPTKNPNDIIPIAIRKQYNISACRNYIVTIVVHQILIYSHSVLCVHQSINTIITMAWLSRIPILSAHCVNGIPEAGQSNRSRWVTGFGTTAVASLCDESERSGPRIGIPSPTSVAVEIKNYRIEWMIHIQLLHTISIDR